MEGREAGGLVSLPPNKATITSKPVITATMLESMTLFDQRQIEIEGAALRIALRDRLLTLPFSGFARVMGTLLEKMGYSDIAFTSRKDFRGRNGKDGAAGGYDLLATMRTAVVADKTSFSCLRRVLVQVKQFDSHKTVYQRSVDELRGACLRAGAAEGMILTTGAVSKRLERSRLASAPFAPVRLVDGEELLDLLVTHRLGVWSEDGGKQYGVDTDYFENLFRECVGNSPVDCAMPEPLFRSVRVTVSVEPLSRGSIRTAAVGSVGKFCHTIKV